MKKNNSSGGIDEVLFAKAQLMFLVSLVSLGLGLFAAFLFWLVFL